ncbi:MAG: SDR family oxidoreductase, partial [Chitinophagales bacterium]|nr:SDR family oxidoreductase [Chitinophagales bacterium]
TIAHLLKKTLPNNIIAFARDEQKAQALKAQGIEVRLGHFDDPASLDRAMQGVEKVLLISGLDHNRVQQHKNIVDAALKAGVKQIAYTGISMRDVNTSVIKPFLNNHFETEDYIKESGLAYTFLRNTLYLDGIPMFAGAQVFDTGIYLPAGDGKVPYALRDEMAEAAANVLLQSGHENRIYEITGGDSYSFEEVAKVLAGLSGKPVTYTDADATTFPDTLKEVGVPEFLIPIIAGFAGDIKNHQYEQVSSDLEMLLGRKPTSLGEGLMGVYNF